MKKILLLVVLLGVLLATGFGQENLAVLRATIPYDFVVGGSTRPAGNYDFSVMENRTVRITNHENGKTMFIGYISRMAADSTIQGKARISFDVKDGKYFVEAIWPEQGDGYLIHMVKGEHTHEIVRSK